jgi:hypothetical protein
MATALKIPHAAKNSDVYMLRMLKILHAAKNSDVYTLRMLRMLINPC